MTHDAKTTRLQLPDDVLLEGIVTTLHADGSPHIAPMGPIVSADFTRLLLRPFRTSSTYQNLQRARQGVLHVTDDVELFARAAVGALEVAPRLFAVTGIEGVVLADACRWYAFRVESIDDSRERAEMTANVVDHGWVRDFLGFNRAKHAVIEAAILATRLELLDPNDVELELGRLKTIVEKTGGKQEHAAFAFLQDFIGRKLAGAEH